MTFQAVTISKSWASGLWGLTAAAAVAIRFFLHPLGAIPEHHSDQK